jgi:rhodanese-related sulfurtransferase
LKAEIRTVVIEAVIVCVVGAGLALAANQFSPRGLALSRNYFPAGTNTNHATAAPIPVTPVQTAPETNSEPSEAEQLSQRLHDKGLQEIKRPAVEKLLHDPRLADGRVVLIDARDEDHYQEGHIPGAYELDPYHPEKQLGAVLPICQAAEQVVVYCTGGECEDADTTALLLRDAGVPDKKLYVYGGGYTEWDDNHLPIETGPRNSGARK